MVIFAIDYEFTETSWVSISYRKRYQNLLSIIWAFISEVSYY